jgi:hypothetical protein
MLGLEALDGAAWPHAPPAQRSRIGGLAAQRCCLRDATGPCCAAGGRAACMSRQPRLDGPHCAVLLSTDVTRAPPVCSDLPWQENAARVWHHMTATGATAHGSKPAPTQLCLPADAGTARPGYRMGGLHQEADRGAAAAGQRFSEVLPSRACCRPLCAFGVTSGTRICVLHCSQQPRAFFCCSLRLQGSSVPADANPRYHGGFDAPTPGVGVRAWHGAPAHL